MMKSLVVVLIAAGTLGCINTTYSRKHETQITDDLANLIVGQFPHHGKAFYEDQVKRTSAALERNPADVEARNDLAAAYLKLERWEDAEAEFEKIEQSHPGRYRTHANLGVLYKKMRQYDKAAHHIRKSLEIQPEGHLGLGDYYLRMLDWLKPAPAMDPVVAQAQGLPRLAQKRYPEQPGRNFLGISYANKPGTVADDPLVNKEYLRTLIIADRTFADVYLVLGDVLAAEGDYQLAIRAYHRADSLGHPRPDVIDDRIDWIYTKWYGQLARLDGYVVEPRMHAERFMQQELAGAATWVTAFESREADLIASGEVVDYKMVLHELDTLGVERAVINELGLVPGAPGQSVKDVLVTVLLAFLGLVVVLTLVVIFFVRVSRRRHARRAQAAIDSNLATES